MIQSGQEEEDEKIVHRHTQAYKGVYLKIVFKYGTNITNGTASAM